MMMPRNVLMFADPGVDDAIALIYALLHPDINVVGIVSGYGNVEVEVTTRNIYAILNMLDMDVPVFGGANQPASDVYVEFYPEVHGVGGLGQFEPEGIGFQLTNFTDLYEVFDRYEGVAIVDVGRNTGLMLAYMLGKQKMEKATDCFLMGGAFLTPGNVTPAAEANFYGDPVASKFVFENIRSHVFPLDATEKALVTQEMIGYLAEWSPIERLRGPLQEMFTFYAEKYQEFVPGIQGAYIHDLLPLMYLTNPELFTMIEREIFIETSTGPARGASIADFRPNYGIAAAEAEEEHLRHKIAMDMDYEGFYYLFMNVFMNSVRTPYVHR
ncbi:nucleoside hydrolase [Alteribacter natronophilus]|uniref:nucleoside hydrolase n=1 Tax=Alteribacter natronophilus TaxID=2583810 RepID=UPI00110E286F|nr:nucleoside hydrolase [Alteribacter natronophilus]TMW72974.1 nucleoside hydrolase [Alteribacter natronophilus]